MVSKSIAILGAGSWGTAIAIHLAHEGYGVYLWGHDPDHLLNMEKERSNARFLPGIPFPSSIMPSSNLEYCVKNAEDCIIAVPSHAFAEVLLKLPKPAKGLAWLTKGLDPSTHQLLSQLVHDRWGDLPVAIISGPSFAKEVASLLPTALVVASHSEPYRQTICDYLHHQNVRVYQSSDEIGVQLCGAIKNVLAIACGISDGLHYGANARAALITRGLAEMTRLGTAMGAQPETFMGLAGVGDLVLTCTDDQSRNRRFGLCLGQGKSLIDAQKVIGQVVEGKHNAAQVSLLAEEHQVDMPICQEVHAILKGSVTPEAAVKNLMSRPPKSE